MNPLEDGIGGDCSLEQFSSLHKNLPVYNQLISLSAMWIALASITSCLLYSLMVAVVAFIYFVYFIRWANRADKDRMEKE